MREPNAVFSTSLGERKKEALSLSADEKRELVEFLQAQEAAGRMLHHITHFLESWLDVLARDHRSYVTVAIGCTGGQHRSVYLVEALAQRFESEWVTLKRHRELDAS